MRERSSRNSISVRRAMRLNYDGKPMSLPPVFAASALYDNLLQAALRQFFSRATFETEPIPSLSSDGRLAIEPTGDPSVLTIRWFGSRHVLHVPARRPVHFARGAAGARPRRGAVDPLSRHLRSAAHARARRALPWRDRGPLCRRLRRRDVVHGPGADPRGHRGDGDRGAARRGDVQLREPADFVRRAASSTPTATRSTRGARWASRPTATPRP